MNNNSNPLSCSSLVTQYFTVKPKPGFSASSFEKKGLCYIGSDRLLPAKIFLEAEKPRGGYAYHDTDQTDYHKIEC